MNKTKIAPFEDLQAAINKFNQKYICNYWITRRDAIEYINTSKPTTCLTELLAKNLVESLYCWGAGKRNASKLKKIKDISTFLQNQGNHSLIQIIANGPQIKDLDILSNKTGKLELVINLPNIEIQKFNDNIANILKIFAENLFETRIKSATYPMKALLLLTGFMPAFDGNVKKGFQKAVGLGSNNAYQITLSDKKIAMVPFLLGQLVKDHQNTFDDLIASNKKLYSNDYARLLDILLFQQGKTNSQLITLSIESYKNKHSID